MATIKEARKSLAAGPRGPLVRIGMLDKELLTGVSPGTWVAISRDQKRIVGRGKTVAKALEEAREKGERRPFIIRVPTQNTGLIL